MCALGACFVPRYEHGGCSQRTRLKPTGVQALITSKFLVTGCLHISFPLRGEQRGLSLPRRNQATWEE